VALNIACALSRLGAAVGLLDADFYGPSIPTMTGVNKKPVSRDGKLLEPLEAHGLKVMSIGFVIEADQALIWRGPMLQGALMQLVRDVNWGELDYLIVDLPPGTGDIPLTVAQQLKSAGAVLVTTPQDVALIDVIRAKQMFDKLMIPVLGIVENMSQFICPHCGKGTHIFDHGGGKKASEHMDISFLGEVPLELKIRQGGDRGLPVVVGQPDSAEGLAFIELAKQVKEMTAYARDHAITIAVMGCRVNGPGETDDADLGLWCGPTHVNLKRRSVELGAFPYDEILPKLRHELDKIIAERS
jgi:ATP-binding protein involved in chromosome partitioning